MKVELLNIDGEVIAGFNCEKIEVGITYNKTTKKWIRGVSASLSQTFDQVEAVISQAQAFRITTGDKSEVYTLDEYDVVVRPGLEAGAVLALNKLL